MAMILIIGMSGISAFAEDESNESYTATSMRLSHYEGEVEILDAEGQSRFIMENARFNSGETLTTGEESVASVELEEQRIVTLDEQTSVGFVQEGDSMTMNLKDGTLLLDVERKLDDNESLDIQTSNMTIGIRGTIVYLLNLPAEDERLEELGDSAQAKIRPLLDQQGSAGGAANTAATGGAANTAATGGAANTAAAGGAANGATAGGAANAAGGTANGATGEAAADMAEEAVTVFGVLQGTAEISWIDTDGALNSVSVSAGSKAIMTGGDGSDTSAGPVVAPLEEDDISAFIENNLTAEQLEEVRKLIADNQSSDSYGYPDDGNWTYCGLVILESLSASKIYDGTPLTEEDLLVSGLPEAFTVKAVTSGSQTDAGSSENPITEYTIYNDRGEDVTSHFANIRTMAGQLVVDPVPLTVTTESAVKVYDGTALTRPEAQVSLYSGYRKVKTGQNISYINSPPLADQEDDGTVLQEKDPEETDSVILYGIVGEVLVHGTNPLTGETKEAYLTAGQKLTVCICNAKEQDNNVNDTAQAGDAGADAQVNNVSDNAQAGDAANANPANEKPEDSIEFIIEDMAEEDLTEEVLRLYADNPDLLVQACRETGWDQEKIRQGIGLLPETDAELVEENGVMLRKGESGAALRDITGILISIDSDITGSGDRYLGDGEVRFLPVTLDESITARGTGSQTRAGSSVNTCEIDWGTANPDNYAITEDLGTLTVTRAQVTVTTGSASKVYDGTPLTNAEAYITGLAAGETATVTAAGSQTDVGTSLNTYTISWGSASAGNYTIMENLGTLTVTSASTSGDTVTLTADSASKVYDGTPLQAAGVTASGLPGGYTVEATVSGSQTAAGTSANTIVSYIIRNSAGENVTGQFTNVITQPGTLTVEALQLNCDLGGKTMTYNGYPIVPEVSITYANGDHAGEAASVTGTQNGYQVELFTGDQAVLTAAGGGSDAGSHTLTGTVAFSKGTADNYEIFWSNTEYTIEPAPLTVTTGSAEKVYDGTPLSSGEASLSGLVGTDAATVTATGSITDAGEQQNTYEISWGNVNPSNYAVTAAPGILKVTKAGLTVTTGSASKPYDSTPLTSAEAYITGLKNGETATVTAIGTITEVGTTSNTYTISWGTAKEDNYTISTENLGTLEITEGRTTVTITIESASKEYDGTPLTGTGDIIAEGLPEGYSFVYGDAFITSSQTDAGSTQITYDPASIFIYGPDGAVANDSFNIVVTAGYQTVTPCEVTFDLHGYTSPYIADYIYLSQSITGVYNQTGEAVSGGSQVQTDTTTGSFTLKGGGAVNITVGGIVTESAGTYELPVSIVFTEGNSANYSISYTNTAMIIIE